MARGADVTLHPSAAAMARSADRDLERAPHAERTRSIVMTTRCPCCQGEWTLEGSYAAKACTRCHTPLSFT